MDYLVSSKLPKRHLSALLCLGVVLAAALCTSSCGGNGGGSGSGTSNNVAQRPFGSHSYTYTAGSIQPNNVSQSQMDSSTSGFYDAWKSKYLVNGCGSDRYYVWVGDTLGGGKAPGSISVSEGHGYGMMIVALMAGYDTNAKTYFDGMFKYFKDHPATSSANLMAWNQVAGCGNSGSPYGGSGTATDGDLDIGYALILADRQWGSTGAINYLQEAKNVIAAVKAVEVNPSTQTIFLGDFVDPLQPNFYYGTRPSDFMPEHFRAYQAVTQDSSWTGVVNELYSIIATIRTNYSPATGLISDFVINTNTSPQPAGPNYLETAYDGEYNYNACRVPWRIGTDYLVSGDTRAFTMVQTVNTWIKGKTAANPANIVDGYTLAGANSAGATGTSLAFVGPFAVSAMSDSSNQAWLNSLWSQITSTPLSADDYYGNTLKLLSMIVVSKNWWTP